MKSRTRATHGGPITEQPVDRSRQGLSPCGIRRGRSAEMTIEVSLGDEISARASCTNAGVPVSAMALVATSGSTSRWQDEIAEPQCREQDLGEGPQLTRRLAEVSGSRVDARLARLLLKLAERMGIARGPHTFVPLPLARQELADLTGTTIETTIRIMSRWQKEDVVHTEKDGFVILDRSVLEEIAAG